MDRYHHRIADRYGCRVASLAVLGDTEPGWWPGVYREDLWGCSLTFDYPCCKLLDFGAAELDAAAVTNPAAVMIAAHLATQRTAGDPARRLGERWELTWRLYERGYGKRDILELYRLLDWLMALPEEQTVDFHRQLHQFEEEQAMP
ncbi:MAG: hypothetical protein KF791_14925 [Verrucomicrobiae bacterium]|nr:hypothetical protein [Verrucomicrobiae bacterium]